MATSDPQRQPRKRHSAPTPPWVLEADTALLRVLPRPWTSHRKSGWLVGWGRGGGGGQNKKGRQRMRLLNGIIHSIDVSLSKLWRR